MYHGTLQSGQVYIVHLRGRYIKARFSDTKVYDRHFNPNSYNRGRNITHHIFTNLETGRSIVLKSKVKIVRVFTPELDGVRPAVQS